MGAKTKLDIETDQLHSAAGKAGQTLAASVIGAIPPPPPAAMSQLDAALAAVSAQSELLRSNVDTLDSTWATKQSAALTESPPVLQQQDVQGATEMESVPQSEYPMPQINPIAPADGVQPASYSTSMPENGPWGLDDGEWELDEWGSPQPVWPQGGASGGAGPGAGVSGGVAPI